MLKAGGARLVGSRREPMKGGRWPFSLPRAIGECLALMKAGRLWGNTASVLDPGFLHYDGALEWLSLQRPPGDLFYEAS